MMQSLNLRHFPERDPAPRNYDNEDKRAEIAKQTEEFLARGGQIQQVEGCRPDSVIGRFVGHVNFSRLQ